jgi:hypothetical protein
MRYLSSFESDAGGGGGPGGFKGDWESLSFALLSAAGASLLSPASSFLLVLEAACFGSDASSFRITVLLLLACLELPCACGELDGADEVGKLPVDCRVRPGLRLEVLLWLVNATSLLPGGLRLSVDLGVAGTDACFFCSCRGVCVVGFNADFGFDDDGGSPACSCRFAAAPFDDDGLAAEIFAIAIERHTKHKYFASLVILLTSSSWSM